MARADKLASEVDCVVDNIDRLSRGINPSFNYNSSSNSSSSLVCA